MFVCRMPSELAKSSTASQRVIAPTDSFPALLKVTSEHLLDLHRAIRVTSVTCDSSVIPKGKMRYMVACFASAGLFHGWAPFLDEGLPVYVAFFSQLQRSVAMREKRG